MVHVLLEAMVKAVDGRMAIPSEEIHHLTDDKTSPIS